MGKMTREQLVEAPDRVTLKHPAMAEVDEYVRMNG
jgi:hypothetical protein